jgi:hypothetical protein
MESRRSADKPTDAGDAVGRGHGLAAEAAVAAERAKTAPAARNAIRMVIASPPGVDRR